MAQGDGNSAEARLTRYLILKSEDEGATWRYLGAAMAASSEAALRSYFSNPPTEQAEALFVATSENAFKPRKVAATVRTSISDAEVAFAPPEAPAQETLA